MKMIADNREFGFYLDDLALPDRAYIRFATAAGIRAVRWLAAALYLIALMLGLLLWRLW